MVPTSQLLTSDLAGWRMVGPGGSRSATAWLKAMAAPGCSGLRTKPSNTSCLQRIPPYACLHTRQVFRRG
jgi:hypothetical protein